jgi:hypothetical protein
MRVFEEFGKEVGEVRKGQGRLSKNSMKIVLYLSLRME